MQPLLLDMSMNLKKLLTTVVFASGMETLTGGGLTYDAAHPALSTRLVLAQPSYSVGAPEIDGSLAPKVGFLLGCLFLMFGRKKQSTEPMLAVSTI